MRGVTVCVLASGVAFASSLRAEEPAPGSQGVATEPSSAGAPVETTGARSVPEVRVEGQRAFLVNGEQRVALDLRAPVLAVHLSGVELHVAHGDAGVAVYDVSDPAVPRLLREFPTPGASATGFATIEGQLWVLTVSRAARPLGPALPTSPETALAAAALPAAEGPSPAEVPEPEPAAGERAAALRVVNPGTVELAIGRRDGVRVGDRFAIYRIEPTAGAALDGFAGEELVALAEVVALKESSARADLGRATVVRATDMARHAREDQRESNAYPVRVPHVAEVSGVLRPIINAGSPLGVGVLAEASGSTWGKAYFADVVLQPVGLGWTEDGNVVSAAALFQAGYDGRAFAVGLGAGVSWINGDVDYMLEGSSLGSADESAGGPTETVERQNTQSAFTLAQLARLGARDGLNLVLRNLLLLHEDTEADTQGFIYGGTLGKLTVPLDRRNDLFLEAGGGIMGYWLVGAGVGTWLVGNGSPGSWKLSISAGAGGISGSREVSETRQFSDGSTSTYTYDDEVGISGPMVSAGVARRFAW